MHLLNTLPQRLDPGATPTFAGLIAPSLTSPAATPLTLATTDSGAAITVLSASNNVGIGTVTPAAKLEIAGTYADEGSERTPATVEKLSVIVGGGGDGATYFKTGWSNSANSGIFTVGVGYYLSGSQIRDVITLRGSTGDVSIPSTTAASANAGALVLQGGISAGNTGSAASYFGGAVTAAGTLRATNGNLYTYGESENAANGILYFNSAANNYIYGSGSQLAVYTAGVLRATIASTGTTFAGAVSITGNIGFYGQAATAKPTGVAVTAAAIHAALVTLNLIAA